MQYGMLHTHRGDQSGGQVNMVETPVHQTAHIKACKTFHTAYTTVFLRMNTRGSKHVGDNRN